MAKWGSVAGEKKSEVLGSDPVKVAKIAKF